jgi:hypothetical protein
MHIGQHVEAEAVEAARSEAPQKGENDEVFRHPRLGSGMVAAAGDVSPISGRF